VRLSEPAALVRAVEAEVAREVEGEAAAELL
jgi:hypothetical protein